MLGAALMIVAVRDFVHIEPAEVSGIVEQFGLRTTLIRSLNGDRTSPTRRSRPHAARANTERTRSSVSPALEILVRRQQIGREHCRRHQCGQRED
jgi:hypothetical protein